MTEFTLCMRQNMNYLRGRMTHSLSYTSNFTDNTLLIYYIIDEDDFLEPIGNAICFSDQNFDLNFWRILKESSWYLFLPAFCQRYLFCEFFKNYSGIYTPNIHIEITVETERRGMYLVIVIVLLQFLFCSFGQN